MLCKNIERDEVRVGRGPWIEAVWKIDVRSLSDHQEYRKSDTKLWIISQDYISYSVSFAPCSESDFEDISIASEKSLNCWSTTKDKYIWIIDTEVF